MKMPWICTIWKTVSQNLLGQYYFPNSESVGFQSLGPGTGDTNMHAPKNRNSPGTFLEPFAVGLQSWANVPLKFIKMRNIRPQPPGRFKATVHLYPSWLEVVVIFVLPHDCYGIIL